MTNLSSNGDDGRSEVRRLYAFVAEQVVAGLFKSDILDRLIDMGVSRQAAADVLEEMERRLSNLRKRLVAAVMSPGVTRDSILREFSLSGYAVTACACLNDLQTVLAEKVPDLVVADAFDPAFKAREVALMMRSHIIGRAVPVFVVSEQVLEEKAFASLDAVEIFKTPAEANELVARARELFLKRFPGGPYAG